MPQSPAQNFALADIEARAADLSDWTATIFDFGETAWREYRSAAWYVAKLRAEGFTVEEGSGGMAPGQ
jgi:aminobenzoyl-glutamate utilization protein B